MSQKRCVQKNEVCRFGCTPTTCQDMKCRNCGNLLEYRDDWDGWECKKCKEKCRKQNQKMFAISLLHETYFLELSPLIYFYGPIVPAYRQAGRGLGRMVPRLHAAIV